jgi:hypothetical protein
MKNSDMPAMPLSGDAYQDFSTYDGTSKTSYNPECQGLTKREMFAMHAPQCPSWFAREFKRNNKGLVFKNTDTEYKEKLSDIGCEKLFFAWRSYYAEQMLQELDL